MKNKIDNETDRLFSLFSDKVGLKIQYESLSPSIFSYFNIRNITAENMEGKVIASIKDTRIRYNFLPLIKGDFSNFLTSVYVDGVSLDLETLIEFAVDLSQTYKINSPDFKFDIQEIKNYIPADLSVKNISLLYEIDQILARLNIREILLENSNLKENIEFSMNGNAYAQLKNTGMELSAIVELGGNLFQNLDNSTLQVNVSNLTNGTISMNRLSLLATYFQKKVEVHSIQSVFPLSVNLLYDLQANTISANLKTQDLNPLSVVSYAADRKISDILRNLKLTIDAGVNCDVNDLISAEKSKVPPVSYNIKSSAYLPGGIIPGGANVSFALKGNEKKVNIDYLKLSGENCEADISLSFLFDSLQASGFAEIEKYTLPNGNQISTELYFDPLDKGFMLFSPQLFVGEKALTALQLSVLPQKDSYDFEFEVSDYSHIESDDVGSIKIEGSYLSNSNYVQTNAVMNRIYMDTVMEFVQQVLPKSQSQSLSNITSFVSSYVLSGDLYFSTDFKSISYNIPYIVAANVGDKVQYLMISGNGNEQSVQLNQLSLILGQYALTASASLDTMPDSNEVFFESDIVAASVPYHFSGVFMPEVFKITGSYGTDFEVRLDKHNIAASLLMDNLPLVFGDLSLIFSTDCIFNYTKQDGPSLQVSRFEVEDASSGASVNPKLLLTADATKYGAQISSISYSDMYSTLSGSADFALNMIAGRFESAVLTGNLKNHFSEEEILLEASVSNPESQELTVSSLLSSLYLSSQIDINSFGLSRFTKSNNANDEITASLFLSGTLEHPFANAIISELNLFTGSEIISGTGSVILEDKDLSIEDFRIGSSMWSFKDFNGSFSLESMTGVFDASVSADMGEKDIEIPLHISIDDSKMPEKGFIPQSMVVNLASTGLRGSFVKKTVPFDVTMMLVDDLISFYSSEKLGLYGSFRKNGEVAATLHTGDFLSAELTGNVLSKNVKINLNNINCNLAKLTSYIAVDEFIKFNSSQLKGHIGLTGSMLSPEFNGALSIANMDFEIPMALPYSIKSDKVLMTIVNSEINIVRTDFLIKNTKQFFSASCKIAMNHWLLDYMDLKLDTPKRSFIPLKLHTPFFSVEGDTGFDIQLFFENNNIDINGSLVFEKLGVMVDVTKLSSLEDSSSSAVEMPDISISTNLDVMFGTHTNLNVNPLMRCILVPDTHVLVKMDSASSLYEIDGQIKIKSGDIAYLNRNFYIKEGNLKFNPGDITNLLVTIRAETRERDDNNQTVRIILSAENQSILNFNPVFSSIPAKSESEIRSLLGQIIVADADSAGDFLFSAGDYVLQSAVIRNLENKLRDSLNFDIFSIRTNILQNTLSSVTGNAFARNGTITNNSFTIGNLLDNSTVYIGKYLGSVLYVDAMFHFAANTPGSVLNNTDITRLSFKPEFGMELELPIVNIRWNMAPNIDALMKQQYVPSTSISLNWKFSF
ncbi:MAG: translocation/assembly module TamB [Treponema sp.]|nr:translocation/assembly module TamB [Treponema sp.]